MTKYPAPPKMSDAAIRELLATAHKAGMAAGEAIVPRPMVVRPDSILINGAPALDKTYVVSEGVCGFAWVTVHPANSKLAKILKAEHRAHNGYHGGMELWVGEFNQSMTRKEAYARAYADVLTAAGFRAYPGSRMD